VAMRNEGFFGPMPYEATKGLAKQVLRDEYRSWLRREVGPIYHVVYSESGQVDMVLYDREGALARIDDMSGLPLKIIEVLNSSPLGARPISLRAQRSHKPSHRALQTRVLYSALSYDKSRSLFRENLARGWLRVVDFDNPCPRGEPLLATAQPASSSARRPAGWRGAEAAPRLAASAVVAPSPAAKLRAVR
jgi:hypothetical protein